MTITTRHAARTPRARHLLRTFGRVAHLVAAGATLAVAFLLALALVPNLWGWSSMVVTSGSMEPALSPGDVVLVQPRDAGDLEPMDIITFRADDGSKVSHRIIDKGVDSSGTSFVTKGDANEDPDGDVVDARNVVGRVHSSVPRVGYLIAWARTPVGLILLACGLAFVVLGGGRRQEPDDEESSSADAEELGELVGP
jgi:signal peptidase I